ncbi:unnamed protein product, partial [Anisakis simplex]|uniref:Arm-DNA-bind_5 domain-containing protein n=1 Tax=Anisakis simplex TaxID=6269 RepID=A0A0M3JIN8_ANISI
MILASAVSSALRCQNGDEVELRISPGTGASEQKMAKKLAALRMRNSERRAQSAAKVARIPQMSKKEHIDLNLTAMKFLNETTPA